MCSVFPMSFTAIDAPAIMHHESLVSVSITPFFRPSTVLGQIVSLLKQVTLDFRLLQQLQVSF